MPFWSDVLRVAGYITAPVLVASGVGAPLGIAIGVAATAGTSLAANEIEKHEENKQLDQKAEQEKQRRTDELERQRQAEELRRQQVEKKLNEQLAYESRPTAVLDACRSGQLSNLSSLLEQLDDTQFSELGLTPLSVCQTQEDRERVARLLQAESRRRLR